MLERVSPDFLHFRIELNANSTIEKRAVRGPCVDEAFSRLDLSPKRSRHLSVEILHAFAADADCLL